MSASIRTSTRNGTPRMTDVNATTQAVAPAWELVDFDRYVVVNDGPVGYIDVIAPLFVCYVGHPYPKAVEIAQVFDFGEAVRLVVEQSASPATDRSAA